MVTNPSDMVAKPHNEMVVAKQKKSTNVKLQSH